MRTKNALILLILVLALSFTNAPGIGKDEENPDSLLETKAISANGPDLKCSLQSKSSTLHKSGSGNLTVSVNSRWVCR